VNIYIMKNNMNKIGVGMYFSIILIIFLIFIFQFVVLLYKKPTSCENLSVSTTGPTTGPTTKKPDNLHPEVRDRIIGNTWYTPNAMSPMSENKPTMSPVTQDSLNNMSKSTSTMLDTIQHKQSNVFRLF